MALRPTTEEVLESILWTFEHQITPTIDDEFATSAARTVANLLRHVQARIRLEGQGLVDDNTELRALLAELGERDDLAELAELSAAVDQAPVSPEVWPSVDALSDESNRLRSALDAVIGTGLLERDQAVAERVDGYLARQLGREAQWAVDPFTGDRR